MRYALIENGLVTNIIWLYEGNAGDFPNAVPMGDRPVQIEDAYENGLFTHDGETVLTPLEEANKTIAELDRAVVDLMYENIIMSLGLL